MKITQQQIEAALAWSDWNPDNPETRPSPDQIQMLNDLKSKLNSGMTSWTVIEILAAAYREAIMEIERHKELFREILSTKTKRMDAIEECEERDRIALKALKLEP
jgi:hypothetical protein